VDRRSESAIEGLEFVAKHVNSDYKRMHLGVAKEEIQRLAAEVERLKREPRLPSDSASVLNKHKHDGFNDWRWDDDRCAFVAGSSWDGIRHRVQLTRFVGFAIAEKLLRDKEQ